MEIAIIAVFVLGYAFIAFEHSVRIDKAATALLTGTLCWTLFVLGADGPPAHLAEAFAHAGEGGLKAFFEHQLMHHVQEIASILFFLLGAMTIVELVDAHQGFKAITDKIGTRNKVKLLWIISIITFFLSSVAGLRAGHPGLLYATTKGAIVQMTRAMAGHHGADNIRVNAVAPGYVYTPMVASRGMTEELRQQRAQSGMLKSEGSAWDVAEAACFLASAAARWITGQTLPVDAGRSAGNASGASPKPEGALR